MKYAVVTGVSRGLGESVARQLLEKRIHIIGISRRENKKLADLARELPADYQHIKCDLSKTSEVEKAFKEAAELTFKENAEVVFLVNNAGVVEPVERAGQYELNDLVDHIHTNLIAPMASVNMFMQTAEKKNIRLIAVNVTSGAADRSVYGWSAYGSAKAGLNRYTSTVALEQADKETKNAAILFNPGIMDTDMQDDIRSSTVEAFKDVETFKQYKESNSLRDTDTVASLLVSIMEKDQEIENGKTYSVYDYL